MTTSSLLPRRRRVPAALRPLARAVGSGILLGLLSTACVVTIHDDGGHDVEECYDEYGDCMDDAESPSEFAACETKLDVCLDGFADDEAGDGDGDGDDAPADSSDGDDDPPHADLDTGDSETETTGGDPDCFEQHATCIGEAQTVEAVEACNVLFDHCIDPGSCDADPDCGCPLPE